MTRNEERRELPKPFNQMTLAALFGFLLLGATACNTMQGMGEDIESGGESLQRESEETQEQM